MADNELTYSRGKNPNSLKNLKKGRSFEDKEKARAAGIKGAEVQRARKTMREIAERIGLEEQEFVTIDGVKVTKTKLEIIMMNFMRECAKTPNHKNVLALRKILGEDIQHIEVEQTDNRYNDIIPTQDDYERAMALLYSKHARK